LVQLFKIRYTRRHEELRQLKEIRNAIDYALTKRNGEDPAMPSLRIYDRASEAFQRASGRKYPKETPSSFISGYDKPICHTSLIIMPRVLDF